jgi:hypothetical protein
MAKLIQFEGDPEWPDISFIAQDDLRLSCLDVMLRKQDVTMRMENEANERVYLVLEPEDVRLLAMWLAERLK